MAQRGSGGTGTENRQQGGRRRWQAGGGDASRSNRRLRAHEAVSFGAPLTAAFIAMAYLSGRQAVAAEPQQPPTGDAATEPREGGAPDTSGQGSTPIILQGLAAAAPIVAPGPLDEMADLLEPRPVDGPSGLEPAGTPAMPATAGSAPAPVEPSSTPLSASDALAAAGAAPTSAQTVLLPEPAGDTADTAAGEDPGPIGEVAEAGAEGATLTGTAANDVLKGGDGADLLTGGAGDDRLEGAAGDDRISGGDGRDTLAGGAGDDRLEGGADNDILGGGAGNDSLDGGAGRDLLEGGGGDDILDGGPGIDRLAGGPGDDILVIDDPADIATGGSGSDTLRVEQGYADRLATLRPAAAPDGAATFVVGQEIPPDLPDGANSYVQQVGAGIEHVELRGEADHDLLGDGGANQLSGNAGDNMIWGGAGDDLLAGGAGEDLLYGGDGNDLLDGGDGADMLYGGAGDDTFLLGLAEDGPDRIFDHRGVNGLRLEDAGDAVISARMNGADLELLADGQNLATILGYADDPAAWKDIAIGGETRPLASLLPQTGDGQSDLLARFGEAPDQSGSAGSDILHGGEGSDWLAGGAGNDVLGGGPGADLLEGGPGNDLLRGGEGDDVYLLRAGDSGIDRIEDAAGSNRLAMPDAGSGEIGGFLAGDDLWVTVDGAPAAIFEGFGQHPEALAGVQTGDGFVPARELAGQDQS